MLTLYHGDTAVCAAKVRVTLFEKQLAWEGKLLDLQKGDQFRAEYVALNRDAVVPTLIHDGVVVTQSTVINEYLDEAFVDRPLRPADPAGRAAVRLWTKREDSIHDAINTMTTALLFRPQELAKSPEEQARRVAGMPDPARREKWRELLDKGLEAGAVTTALVRFARLFHDMERQLGETEWLAGDGFTLADIGLISFFYRMEMLHAAVWRQRFPQVEEWLGRMRARPSFAAAISAFIGPDKIASYTRVAQPETQPRRGSIRTGCGVDLGGGKAPPTAPARGAREYIRTLTLLRSSVRLSRSARAVLPGKS